MCSALNITAIIISLLEGHTCCDGMVNSIALMMIFRMTIETAMSLANCRKSLIGGLCFNVDFCLNTHGMSTQGGNASCDWPLALALAASLDIFFLKHV